MNITSIQVTYQRTGPTARECGIHTPWPGNRFAHAPAVVVTVESAGSSWVAIDVHGAVANLRVGAHGYARGLAQSPENYGIALIANADAVLAGEIDHFVCGNWGEDGYEGEEGQGKSSEDVWDHDCLLLDSD
jgi:hypothetical protein